MRKTFIGADMSGWSASPPRQAFPRSFPIELSAGVAVLLLLAVSTATIPVPIAGALFVATALAAWVAVALVGQRYYQAGPALLSALPVAAGGAVLVRMAVRQWPRPVVSPSSSVNSPRSR